MGSFQAVHRGEAEAGNEIGESPQHILERVAPGTEGLVAREGFDDSEQPDASSIVMEDLEEVLKTLLENFRDWSDGDDEVASDEETSQESDFENFMNDLLHFSQRLVEIRGSDSSSEELMACGTLLYKRFEKSGAIEDLNQAIEYWRPLISSSSDSSANKAGVLSNLGCAYLTRFQQLGELADVNEAIVCVSEAISLMPDGHAETSRHLANLGISHLARFERLGDPVDLNKAIEFGTEAASLTPDDHAIKPGSLNNLGNSYRTRYQRFGKPIDLNKAIEYGIEAISLTPDGHTDKPGYLNNLGISYVAQFERLGDRGDLTTAIECGGQAVSLTPGNHVDKPRYLTNLGISYQTRFERLGEVADLNKAIECGRQAVSLTPSGHPVKPGYLNNLGYSYLARFQRLGEMVDLNQSIECGEESVSLTPNGHADKSTYLNNLGNSYLIRFDRLGGLVDLNKAIELGAEAVALIPGDHAEKPGSLNNLGISYRTRFERLGDLVDLNNAIDCSVQTASLTPDGHADKPGYLNNLGISYRTRFKQIGELVDLNKAVKCGEDAVSLTPEGHADRPRYLISLGRSYVTRLKGLGELVGSHRGIGRAAEVVSLAPNYHVVKAGSFNILGGLHRIQLAELQTSPDLDCAITVHRDAAQSLAGSPSVRLRACLSWARLASLNGPSASYPAYMRAMELLPQLVWIGNTVDRRYSLIEQLGDFATEAAAYAISTNNFELALEWLESGRSIDPGLANRLKDIGFQLEHAGSRSSEKPPLQSNDIDPNIEASNHIQLALEWDALLQQARSMRGFEDFLQPPKSKLLLSAAKSHPIVIINAHESHCDALILQPGRSTILHVPLINFSTVTGHAVREHLSSLAGHRGFVRAGGSAPVSLESVLKDLWSGVVKPILTSLGYTHKCPIDQLPRLTWCATGVLSFLPLHAAGCYDQSQPNAFDLVISSYTPTIGALLTSQSASPVGNHGMLVVGQEHTPGFDRLPCVKNELQAVKKHAQSDGHLQLVNSEATVARVLEAMNQFSWVHMACHGTQNTTDPTQSAIHLHNGSLTLATIAKQSFTNKGLAFLSACQTATGDEEVPDEAVHLAAGLLMAGYPSVIGTMWSIADEDGPEVADKVYTELVGGEVMDYTKSARALHKAIARLRTKVGEKAIMRWAPFIHIGA